MREIDVSTVHLQMQTLNSKRKIRNVDLDGTRPNARFDDMDDQKNGLLFLLDWKM